MLRLPIEDIYAILDHLPLDTLQKLACVSSLYRVVVINYLNRRKSTLFAKHVEDITTFNDMLRHTGSVVSGSLALQLLLPRASINWLNTDMDIYVSLPQKSTVVSFLSDRRYVEVNTKHASPYYPLSAIHSVVTMVKESKRVDVVISNTIDAIYPIFQFHSTPVMNYIGADALFSAYPDLSTSFWGLDNFSSSRRSGDSIEYMRARAKYKRRGFNIQIACAPCDVRVVGEHVSQGYTHCRRVIRTSDDIDCLRMSLDATKLPEDKSKEGDAVVVWSLQGPCGSDVPVKRSVRLIIV
ncbi:hypothetical protein BJ138DRAFT_1166800 [Hygrophoropsis aurantiaca]|uniref:Uncharacterized protein n=1 Tax=Hygrophoropsis aurantiaca TaxID=72124 RepID=A0ACB7ZT93_9AGAM|nr:hypothetical protein BJ138DRAFT_1166800 [Hygrophoropsis aurantiaca]